MPASAGGRKAGGDGKQKRAGVFDAASAAA